MPFSAGKNALFSIYCSKGFFPVYFIQNELDQRAHETNGRLARDFETQYRVTKYKTIINQMMATAPFSFYTLPQQLF